MRTAIVTGAGTGIGRATALKLAAMGHAVVLVGRTAATLEAVKTDIEKSGGQALCLAGDVSKAPQVESIVDRVFRTWGRIDVLVNNAGAAPAMAVADTSVEQWHSILDLNLSAAFYATRAVWPIMRKQHEAHASAAPSAAATGGVIVNLSSMASRDPFPGLGPYAVAKAGVNMLTLATAREGHDLGIRVFCVAPASVDTAMLRGLIGNDRITPAKVLRPEEVADVIAGLVTGTLAHVAGETIFLHRRPA